MQLAWNSHASLELVTPSRIFQDYVPIELWGFHLRATVERATDMARQAKYAQ